jgi:hypothetical protein
MKPEIINSENEGGKDYTTDLLSLVESVDSKIDILIGKDDQFVREGAIRKIKNIVEEFKKHGINKDGIHPYFQTNKKAMEILTILAEKKNDYEATIDELKKREENRLAKEFHELAQK